MPTTQAESSVPVILVVDDEVSELTRISSLFTDRACRVETVSTGKAAVQRVQRYPFPNLVFLDIAMPGMDGLETLKQIRHVQPDLRVIMLAADDDPQKIVRSVRLGADDCMAKVSIGPAIKDLFRQDVQTRSDDNESEPADVSEALIDGSFFVAASPAMRKLRMLVGEVARTDIPVLCIGESGTGKEVVARLLHLLSSRSRHTFLKVNCAALPSELLESELFGYEQGAFTGAVRSKPGKFEICAGGTILLDELGEMPPELQAKLLHVLQDGEFTRLGGRLRIKADVRVIAATNVDVRAALASKRLREDLYYRLSAIVFEVPPLRERSEEVPILLRHFLKKYGGQSGLPHRPASTSVMEFAAQYDWPGNVRELENFAKRYLALGEQALVNGNGNGNHLHPTANDASAPSYLADHRTTAPLKSHVSKLKHDAEVSGIVNALERTHWNRKEAARLLQISYKALLGKLRQYDLDPKSFPGR